MFERFTRDARAVVSGAEAEARAAGMRSIEAEHLLLAATRRDAPAARALAELGLDPHGVTAALATETERSLLAVGITPSELEPPGPPVATAGRVRAGASFKLALERALRAAVARGDRRIETGHVVLGVLKAEAGTVPRALELAGIDRAAAADRVAAALSSGARA
jgi:ATP-dependent Clp protease ATP-binding subunit ClpA